MLSTKNIRGLFHQASCAIQDSFVLRQRKHLTDQARHFTSVNMYFILCPASWPAPFSWGLASVMLLGSSADTVLDTAAWHSCTVSGHLVVGTERLIRNLMQV